MAPQPSARSGWSRRAQYGRFFGVVGAVLGALGGLVLLLTSLYAPGAFAGIRGAALDLTMPISRLLGAGASTVEGLWSGAGNYWDAARQNQQLREENAALRQQALHAQAIRLENQQLKALAQLREKSVQSVATGRLVGSSLESERRFAILTAGRSDGVAVGMPVRAAAGLVGRVVDAGLTTSRLLLVSDRAMIVPTQLLRDGQSIIATGRGDGTVDLRPLRVGRNPFRPGDIVVTSGTGGLYPPGVPVARVIRLDDDGALALPIADPSEVSFALVDRPYAPTALPGADAQQEQP